MTGQSFLEPRRTVAAILVMLTAMLCLAVLLPATAVASDGLRTTDDPRRVPLPPRDDSDAPVTVIRGGTLLDGTEGMQPLADAVVVMRGDTIVSAGAANEVDVPTTIDYEIDAAGLYIIPGLIDLHVHFTQQYGDDFTRYTDSDAAAAIRGVIKTGQLLDAGITAVRDVGTRNDVAKKVKEAVQRRLIDGPRVYWSGPIIASRSGHADEITSTATGRPRADDRSHSVRVATGPWDWRLAVREQIRQHVDAIKITAPFTREEIAAAVDEAHMHGIPVTGDTFGRYTVWAAEAGIDSIEHPLDMSSDVIRAMADNGTDFVPTLTAFYNVIEYGYPPAGIPAGGFFYTFSRRFELDHEQHLEMVGLAHRSGVRIGVGSDIPFENEWRYPEDYYTELGLLRDAGLTDRDVFESATRIGAEILKMADRLGTVETGKLADLLIVAANPLDDIQHLREVRWVIADGRVVRTPDDFR